MNPCGIFVSSNFFFPRRMCRFLVWAPGQESRICWRKKAEKMQARDFLQFCNTRKTKTGTPRLQHQLMSPCLYPLIFQTLRVWNRQQGNRWKHPEQKFLNSKLLARFPLEGRTQQGLGPLWATLTSTLDLCSRTGEDQRHQGCTRTSLCKSCFYAALLEKSHSLHFSPRRKVRTCSE